MLGSQQRKRGMQALPTYLEPDIFGFDKETVSATPLDEYMGMVIESYLDAFFNILQKDPLAYAINYHDGAMRIVDNMAAVKIYLFANRKTADGKKSRFSCKISRTGF
ncbi:MAG: hypothetical protein IPI88_10785 [Chitinophagaceae bacterium]|nr:hypothetical protein [Chitinophagaceae bacterium]